MKAADRCKETRQGDRCKKLAGHHFSVSAEPDPIHMGNFAAWKGEGDDKTLLAGFKNKAPKRNRKANRFLKSFDPENALAYGGHNVGIALMDSLAKYFKGV